MGGEVIMYMSTVSKYWSPFFDLLGSDERLHTMFALHGSEFFRHNNDITENDDVACLKTSTIATIIGKDSSTALYHLNRLEKGGLIKRRPIIENGIPLLIWSVTEKWLQLARDFNLDTKVEAFLIERHPELNTAE